MHSEMSAGRLIGYTIVSSLVMWGAFTLGGVVAAIVAAFIFDVLMGL